MLTTFAILIATIVLFIYGRPRADLVALLALLALTLTGILSPAQALAGFSDATVIMIAALFVVSEGLSRTGVTAWLGEWLLRLSANNAARLLVVMMLGAALLSAFISNTGTVATLLPTITAAAWRVGGMPSQFLLPLAFATNTGGLLTLTGTPPNIVVADALRGAGLAPFGFFEFSLIGLPLLAVTLVYLTTIGRRLMPRRNADERPLDLAQAVSDLAGSFGLEEGLFRLRVRARSSLVGQTLAQAALGRDYGVAVLRIDRDRGDAAGRRRGQLGPRAATPPPMPGPDSRIESQDRLLVRARPEAIEALALRYQLGWQPVAGDGASLSAELLSAEVGLAEVLLAVRSRYIGRTLAEINLAEQYRVHVLGIWRGDRQLNRLAGPLAFGDALLVRGRWADIENLRRDSDNFVVVGRPEALARQVAELTPRSYFAVLVLAGMVLMMVTNLVPTVVATLIAAVAMVLGGCLTADQGYNAIGWQSVVLIAAMIPMSTALETTGGAQLIAGGLVRSVGALGPLALLAGVFLLTSLFSQVISNTATAVLIAPIVLQTAAALGLSPYPLLMGVVVAASSAFLTPIGTTTNLMVFTPGGYRFTDYVKVGAPLLLLALLVTLLLVPLIWPF
jgi:di/tricarboxylate transporter